MPGPSRKRTLVCPIDGWLPGADLIFWGILALDHESMKGRRWPQRRRTWIRCPECGSKLVAAQDVSRTVTEVAFL